MFGNQKLKIRNHALGVKEDLTILNMVETYEVYGVKIKGVKPLLVSRITEEDLKPASRKRSSTPDPESEAKKRLYLNQEGEPCIPAKNIKAMIRDAGAQFKLPQRFSTYKSMIKAGIDIEPELVPITDPNNGKSAEWKIDIQIGRLPGKSSRVLVIRPRFDSWQLEFKIINRDPEILKEDILRKILEEGGKWYGLGSYRPEFGRFEVIEFKKLEND